MNSRIMQVFKEMKLKDYKIPILCMLVYAFGVVSCKEQKSNRNEGLSLNPRYLQIEAISSLANCKGPNGNYTTKVISKKDGSLFFSQIFDNQDSPFIAELSPKNKGYVINENKMVLDTLSNIAVEMIRSHDFHRLQTNPSSFFNQIKFEKIVDKEIELYSATDKLNNPVKIYYNKIMKQISGIELLNMMDTTEIIEIIYKKWVESDYGKLAKEIEIIQAKKDTFNFNFETIEIN